MVDIPVSDRWNWSLEPDHTLDVVAEFISGSNEILDYGCGLGRLMRPLAARFPHIAFYGYDPNPEAVAFAHSRALPNETYSTVPRRCEAAYSVLVLQHVPDDEFRWDLADRWLVQWVVGTERIPDSVQRPEGAFPGSWRDPVHSEWRWVTRG